MCACVHLPKRMRIIGPIYSGNVPFHPAESPSQLHCLKASLEAFLGHLTLVDIITKLGWSPYKVPWSVRLNWSYDKALSKSSGPIFYFLQTKKNKRCILLIEPFRHDKINVVKIILDGKKN